MGREVYIVTGATGGIGREISVGILERERDASLVLACRNLLKAKSLRAELVDEYPDAVIDAVQLDLASFSSVMSFADEIARRGLRVKGLVHNAGTMPGNLMMTEDGYESATQTNLLSPVMLTEMLLDCMIPSSHIVFTTSMTRKIARFTPDWRNKAVDRHNRFVTYGRSKKMLTAYALGLAERLTDRDIRVNCSDPWIVATGIIVMENKFVDWMSNAFFRPFIYTPCQGAASAIAALETGLTGMIFTLRKVNPIPPGYGDESVRKIIAPLMDIRENLRNFASDSSDAS